MEKELMQHITCWKYTFPTPLKVAQGSTELLTKLFTRRELSTGCEEAQL